MIKAELGGFDHAVAGLAIRGMIIYKDGEKILHRQYVPEERQNQFSITKSITATAAAFAMQEGLFTLEDPVLEYFYEDAPEKPSAYLQEMKLKHLMTMTMGMKGSLLMGASRRRIKDDNWVRAVLARTVAYKPGTVFVYNNAGPYLLGVLIQKKTGMDLMDYLYERLFAPLGIPTPEAEHDRMGYVFGSSGVMMTVSEVAKFGLFYLNRGVVGTERLLPDYWFDEAGRTQVETGLKEAGEEGYGYLFWTMPEGFRADGKFGQYCIVLPGKNAVIAVNSMEQRDSHKILEAVMEEIVPQL